MRNRKQGNYFYVELDDDAMESLRSLFVAFPDLSRNKVIGLALNQFALSLPAHYEFIDNAWKLR